MAHWQRTCLDSPSEACSSQATFLSTKKTLKTKTTKTQKVHFSRYKSASTQKLHNSQASGHEECYKEELELHYLPCVGH